MPIYLLGKKPIFPPAEMASPEGIVAIGGDLSTVRLLNAYKSGIFPWFSKGDPIIWWSVDPRMVLFPNDLHVSRSMKRLLYKSPFYLTYDKCFGEVIENCRKPRKYQQSTWINNEMCNAYTDLYQLGYAHSVEVRDSFDDQLVGGLYGVSLGKCFFGESMFQSKPNASKFAFIILMKKLFKMDFKLIDCQVPSPHLKTLGCKEIPRKDFLALLSRGLAYESIVGKWDFLNDISIF